MYFRRLLPDPFREVAIATSQGANHFESQGVLTEIIDVRRCAGLPHFDARDLGDDN